MHYFVHRFRWCGIHAGWAVPAEQERLKESFESLKETELIAKLAQAIADNGDDLMVMVSADDRKKLRVHYDVLIESVSNGGKVVTLR